MDHEKQWPPLDLVFVEPETFQNVIKEARGVEVMGRKLLVPSAEHLIALKLPAIKNDPKREAKDLNDLFERIQKWAGTRT